MKKLLIALSISLTACAGNTQVGSDDIFTRLEPLSPECRKAVLVFNVINAAYDDIAKNDNSFTDKAMLHTCVADTLYKSTDAEINTMVEIRGEYAMNKMSIMYKTCNETITTDSSKITQLYTLKNKLSELNEYTIKSLTSCPPMN